MARLLMRALDTAGYEVSLVSHLRPYLRSPDSDLLAGFQSEAATERARIAKDWARRGTPDLWFTYHPYYKSPDLLGPALCSAAKIPYVTAEASWSARRTAGDWGPAQEIVVAGLEQAGLNLSLTERDRRGLRERLPDARIATLAPFIDTAPFDSRPPRPDPGHLVTVAMMRPGDKLSSYRALALALTRLKAPGWRLSIAGDGPARPEVEEAFAAFGSRVRFLGALGPEAVADLLSSGAVYVWPGHGEAYGLAYLEAQAAGLPVIAERTAGVPEVVRDGRTGLLTAATDAAAFAQATDRLLTDENLRDGFARAARSDVRDHHGIGAAADRLHTVLAPLTHGDQPCSMR